MNLLVFLQCPYASDEYENDGYANNGWPTPNRIFVIRIFVISSGFFTFTPLARSRPGQPAPKPLPGNEQQPGFVY